MIQLDYQIKHSDSLCNLCFSPFNVDSFLVIIVMLMGGLLE